MVGYVVAVMCRGFRCRIYCCEFMHCSVDYLLISKLVVWCGRFCIQWLQPCMDVLERVINTIQYNTHDTVMNEEICKNIQKSASFHHKYTGPALNPYLHV
jgi:hypothetical protein